jgi:hypothetical protein
MAQLQTGGSVSGLANVDAFFNLSVATPPNIQALSISTSTGIQQITMNGGIGLGLQILSVGTGGVLVFEGSGNGTDWAPMNGLTNPVGTAVSGTSAPGAWQFDCQGVVYFRVRATALTSGTITGILIATANGSVVMLEQGTAGASPVTNGEAGLVTRNIPTPTTLSISSTAAANTGLTVTLPSAGAGLFHYITGIEITRNATAVLAGTATLVITTTNLPGSRAWSVGNAMIAGGTQVDVNIGRSNPIKSSVAATATTIVMPVPGAAVLWRCNVDYYTGP